jgi:adenylate cyclase
MSEDPSVYRFDGFVLNLSRGALLTTNGEQVQLRRKSFELLRLLVENAGHLLDREAINQAVWPDITVTDESITQCVRDVRRALGDESQQILKTVRRRGYIFAGEVTASRNQHVAGHVSDLVLLSDRPSIAVLAFTNMSGDPDQEYFSDGIADDIVTELSRSGSLFVISRNSSFTYKGRAVDVKQVARELGVRYIVEGSVRRNGDRMRVTCQLIDAISGGHIWADRFEGNIADLFEFQDRVTESVVSAIGPSLQHAQAVTALSKPTDSLDAYDCYLRALLYFHAKTKVGFDAAVTNLRRALEFDQGYALAKSFLSYLFVVRNALGWGLPHEHEQAFALAREALATAPDDPIIARWVAHPLVYFPPRDYDLVLLVLRRAIMLSPYFAQLLRTAGVVHLICDEPIEAIGYCQRAMQLSPLDPEMPIMQMEYGMALVGAGRNEEALSRLAQAVVAMPTLAPAYRFLIIAFWRLNRMNEMHDSARRLLAVDPNFRISSHVRPHRNVSLLGDYVKALRAADLPE